MRRAAGGGRGNGVCEGARGEEQPRARGEPRGKLLAISLHHLVSNERSLVRVHDDIAARFVVHHRSEHCKVRVRSHGRHMGGAESGKGDGSANRMRKSSNDPYALVTALFMRQVLGALIALRDATPSGDLVVDATNDHCARVKPQASTKRSTVIGHATPPSKSGTSPCTRG